MVAEPDPELRKYRLRLGRKGWECKLFPKKTMKSISDSFHIGDSSVCFPTLSSNNPILSGH